MNKNLKFSEINNKNVFTPEEYAAVGRGNLAGYCSDGYKLLPCSDINLKTGDRTETNSKITIKDDDHRQTFACDGDCCKIPPTSDEITQLVWNNTENRWNCTVSPDTPDTFGCLDVNGGTCTRMKGGAGKTYTNDTCDGECAKVKLGFIETINMGCYGELHPCPTGYKSHPYTTSAGGGTEDWCNKCTKTHICELNAEDLSNADNCFKIKGTLQNKCPHIPISEGTGCGYGNVWGNCNLGYVSNPNGYTTTLYGRPNCGWFGVPCNWDSEESFCKPGGDECARGSANPIRTLTVGGEEYNFDSTPGAFKNQGVCAIQIKKQS